MNQESLFQELPEMNPTRKCRVCYQIKPKEKFSKIQLEKSIHPVCATCLYERERDRETTLKRGRGKGNVPGKGISILQTRDMLERQCYRCDMCDVDITEKTGRVDHNHTTGNIRAVICQRCNIALGIVENKDILEKARLYLERHNE